MKRTLYLLSYLLTAGAMPQALSGQTITWSEHIAPIIYTHCTSCHRPGEIAPFPLTNYQEAYNWAGMIGYVTEIRYMPPWKADADYGVRYLDENYLDEEQIALIRAWVNAGAPQGDPALEPPLPVFPSGSQVGTPDLVLSYDQAYVHKGNNQDEYRYFVLPTGLTQDRDLVALEMRPGNTRIVHHALFWTDTTGTAAALDAQTPEYGYSAGQGSAQANFGAQLPTYVPGAQPNVYRHGMAQRIHQGSDLVVQVHFAPTPLDEPDSSTFNLFFADQPATRQVRTHIMLPPSLVNGPFVIPPDEVRRFHGQFKTPLDVSLVGIMPHAHLLAKDWEVFAVTPENDTLPLIRIGDWDFNWQGTYYFRNLVKIPKNSVFHALATYDNTADNPFNPNFPPQTVTWGEGTADEMFYLPLLWVPYLPGDEELELEEETPTAVEPPFAFSRTKLYPVYPNPARGEVRIGFTLDRNQAINLVLFDLHGRPVRDLIDQVVHRAGEHLVQFDTAGLSPGTYFLRLLTENGESQVSRLILH